MFSSKAISAAIEISNGETWADVMRGFTYAEVREVAAVLESDGQDDLAQEILDAVF